MKVKVHWNKHDRESERVKKTRSKQTQVVAAIEQAVLSASASLLSSYRWYSLFVKQQQQPFFEQNKENILFGVIGITYQQQGMFWYQ